MAQLNPITDRRFDQRKNHRGHGTLSNSKGDWHAHIINLSRHGALVAVLDPLSAEECDKITFCIDFQENTPVTMEGRIAHIKDHFIGLDCEPVSEQDKNNLTLILDMISNDE